MDMVELIALMTTLLDRFLGSSLDRLLELFYGLWIDNWIPRLFAKRIGKYMAKPMDGLPSDRPQGNMDAPVGDYRPGPGCILG